MPRLLGIVFAVLMMNFWNVQYADAQTQTSVSKSFYSNDVEKLLHTIKELADQKQSMDMASVKQVLGVDLIRPQGKQGLRCGSYAINADHEYRAQAKDFWFKHMSGQDNVIPNIRYCIRTSRIGNKPEYTVLFRNISGYTCIWEHETKSYFPESKFDLVVDGPLTLLYKGKTNEEWGRKVTFSFYGGCLGDAEISQSEENGNHYAKVMADVRECQYSTRDKYCKEHLSSKSKDYNAMSQLVYETCGLGEKFYNKEPFDEHIRVPPHPQYDEMPPYCGISIENSKE